MGSGNSHRLRLDDGQLAEVLAAAGIDPRRLAGSAELGDATFNTAYRIRLTDGRGLVLKVAPDPAGPRLRHERDIIRTEALFYRRARAAVPVPEVVHTDLSRELLGSDFLLMTELRGENWHRRAARLGADDRARLRTELGGLVAGLHRVEGTEFGYPQGTRSAGWRTAFTGMLVDLLADAERYGTMLPRPIEEIWAVTSARAEVLDEVTVPVLVHFDLWAGNILLDGNRISGLVDGERAFWGDPLADLVSPALFGSIEDDRAFLAGYGDVRLDRAARSRLALYRCYLYLIMLVEGGPRGYAGPERDRTVEIVTRHLNTALAELTR